MRSSNWIRLGGLALVVASLVLSGVFSVQAGPLGQQATAEASQEATTAPTEAATTPPTQAPTVKPTDTVEPTATAVPTEVTTAEPTEAPTQATTPAPVAAATKYPPCPGPATLGTEEATAAATANATAEATAAVFTPGYLGIAGETVDSCGTRVLELEQGGPADKAGLQVGDVIVAVNDKPYGSLDALRTLIESTAPDTQVNVVVKRAADELTISVVLGTRPAQTPPTVAPEATQESTAEPTANATAGQ